ncbi:SigE family RNA polymerase sigma factor [Streptodolium elevatio]|uniref:SigE family RNA polymerase sigma factor n=1 Tax=Streptodolium elevatio TaxID=3157996 RepID=A0ABV3DWN8_9ACTN
MGDPPGFHEYASANRDRLVRFGWLLTGDRQSAEDLVQTALERVWLRWGRVSRGANVDAYVHKVMTTTHLTWRRRLWHREQPTDLARDERAVSLVDNPDALAVWDERDALLRVLETLPPRQRAVIVLRYFLDLTEVDCAEALSCSVGTVKSQTSKALRALRASNAMVMHEGGGQR